MGATSQTNFPRYPRLRLADLTRTTIWQAGQPVRLLRLLERLHGRFAERQTAPPNMEMSSTMGTPPRIVAANAKFPIVGTLRETFAMYVGIVLNQAELLAKRP